MKNLVTIFVALTLTLVSCKKESVLTSYTQGSFEINREIDFTSQGSEKNLEYLETLSYEYIF